MTTINDVALRAGVSPSTVSRTLRGLNVSVEKARLIRSAVSELDFIPNGTARNLRNHRSSFVTLIVPDIEDPFFAAVARGMEDLAYAAGFSAVICNSDDRNEKLAKYLMNVGSGTTAGIVIFTEVTTRAKASGAGDCARSLPVLRIVVSSRRDRDEAYVANTLDTQGLTVERPLGRADWSSESKDGSPHSYPYHLGEHAAERLITTISNGMIH